MPVKKSDLYRSLWKSCDELRGGMDASQYKDYVLVLLFVKYVSDKYAGQPDALLDVPREGSFAAMMEARNKPDIGDRLNKIVARLAEANDLGGVIDVADWNDPDRLGRGNEMVDKLTKLVGIFAKPELDFRSNRAEGDDLLGDAYEYLMRHFATESGKSKGQFYTPAEVSRVMAQVIGLGQVADSNQTIHDPACGSGSLLIKAHDEARSRTGLDLALYGQEMDNATRALARMNMILHGCATAEVELGNTLADPQFTAGPGVLKRFDFVVANPPFSTKAWSNGIDPAHDDYGRFAVGIPPQRNGDYAFLLHALASLKSTGKGAIILPHGVLFRGNAEGVIRRAIVERGYVSGIIGLPPNLFYGTGIPACIVVLDKSGAAARDGVFMVDASRGYRKDGNKNRLRAQDIHRIVDTFARRADVPGYARLVPLAEIAGERNDYNLNLPRYVDAGAAEDRHDLEAHLRGGIPERDLDALGAFWEALPGVREALVAPERPGYARLVRPAAEVGAAVREHPSFARFAALAQARFDAWRAEHEPRLRAIVVGDRPKALVEALSEGLLATFRGVPLVDAYDVYQHLMDYWAQAMQDDVYLIAQGGWREAARPRSLAKPEKGEKRTEQPDFKVGKLEFRADLIPPALLVARYFAAEQAAIDAREAELAGAEQELEALREEHGSEGGLLEAVADDAGEISAAAVAARLGELTFGEDTEEEGLLLTRYQRLLQDAAEHRKAVRVARAALEARVAKRYDTLSEDEVRGIVVAEKWLAKLQGDVRGEVDRAVRALAERVRLLGERYEAPLPRLSAEVESLTERVNAHLRRMLLTGEQRLPGFSREWRRTALRDLGSFSKGAGIRRDELSATGVPCIRYGEIYTRYGAWTAAPASRISESVARTSQRIRPGDVLFAASGETAEEIGKAVAYVGCDEAYAGGDIVIFTPAGQNSMFLGYLLNHSTVVAQKARAGQGDAVVHIGARQLGALEMLVPDLDEQRAIASVLSDMDAELAALEQRLTKTRALKQAMMQELLTGRTRLVPSTPERPA